MELNAIAIPARSRVDAMDLSLVLVSQGIESSIARDEESKRWILWVAEAQHASAVETIRLYRLENRGWGLRHDVFQAGLVFDWVSVVWVALVCAFYFLNDARLDLRTPGILDAEAVGKGQWWRLFTAVWLHADLAHLASNAMFGFVLLGLTMGRFGAGAGLLAAYWAGAGGNLLSWACASKPQFSLGASGMVMGCLGLLAIQSLSLWRKTPHTGKHFVASFFAGVMLFVLLGLTPGTDVVAHLGGFCCGLILGAAMIGRVRILRKPWAGFLCAVIFLVLVLLPWSLALRHPG